MWKDRERRPVLDDSRSQRVVERQARQEQVHEAGFESKHEISVWPWNQMRSRWGWKRAGVMHSCFCIRGKAGSRVVLALKSGGGDIGERHLPNELSFLKPIYKE